jgi:hypothetical protein
MKNSAIVDPLIAPFSAGAFESPYHNKTTSANNEEMQIESGSDSKTSVMKQLEGGMNNMNLKTPIKK